MKSVLPIGEIAQRQPVKIHVWRGLVCAVFVGSALGCSNRIDPHAGPAQLAAYPLFEDATEAAGLGGFLHETGAYGQFWYPEIHGSGGAFLDFDGDHWVDVVLAGGGAWPESTRPSGPPVRLYRNQGDGIFMEVTEKVGLADLKAYSHGFAAADYDNDGDVDLFVTTYGRNLLLRNDVGPDGQRRFVEVATEAGVAGPPTWSTAAVFLDADGDGWLDLFVGNYVSWTRETNIRCLAPDGSTGYCTPEAYRGEQPQFYRNNGDGTFTEQGLQAGIRPAPGKTLGAVATDVNGDGWIDLLVANDTEPDQFYRNAGDGTFYDIGLFTGMALDPRGKARAGMGIDAGVVDHSGRQTVLVGNFALETMSVYRYEEGGTFEDRTAVSGLMGPTLAPLTFGLTLFDAESDGDLDVLAINGHVQENVDRAGGLSSFRQRPQLLVNDGDGRFVELKMEGSVFDKRILGRGGAWADYDRDGDMDLLVTENGGPAHLWKNLARERNPAGTSYLRLVLEGRESNRSAIGATGVAYAGGRPHMRTIRAGSSYLSQSQADLLFTLGATSSVDSLVVSWPSGSVTHLVEVPVNEEFLLIEGSDDLRPLRPEAVVVR